MVVILMGVTGCGKTTVGKLLAQDLGWKFHDADHFHPETNVEKMRQGIPLDDSDRIPWLKRLSELIGDAQQSEESFVLACSALKQMYREILKGEIQPVQFVYLKGSLDLVKERLGARKGHYMNPNLLPSQFAILEEPDQAEAIHMDISPQPEMIARNIRVELGL